MLHFNNDELIASKIAGYIAPVCTLHSYNQQSAQLSKVCLNPSCGEIFLTPFCLFCEQDHQGYGEGEGVDGSKSPSINGQGIGPGHEDLPVKKFLHQIKSAIDSGNASKIERGLRKLAFDFKQLAEICAKVSDNIYVELDRYRMTNRLREVKDKGISTPIGLLNNILDTQTEQSLRVNLQQLSKQINLDELNQQSLKKKLIFKSIQENIEDNQAEQTTLSYIQVMKKGILIISNELDKLLLVSNQKGSAAANNTATRNAAGNGKSVNNNKSPNNEKRQLNMKEDLQQSTKQYEFRAALQLEQATSFSEKKKVGKSIVDFGKLVESRSQSLEQASPVNKQSQKRDVVQRLCQIRAKMENHLSICNNPNCEKIAQVKKYEKFTIVKIKSGVFYTACPEGKRLNDESEQLHKEYKLLNQDL